MGMKKEPWMNKALYIIRMTFTDYGKESMETMIQAIIYRLHFIIALSLLNIIIPIVIITSILLSRH